MRPLTNPIRAYAWGSRTAIASIQHRPVPSAWPEAELWMGAHPSAPSTVAGEEGPVPLTEVIARDPDATLGPAVVRRFGARLPYLVKILAAAQPLSLQAHPDADQARAGFAAEVGLAPDAPERNYADPYHKPELLVAVEEFDALCGFRDPAATAALLRTLGVPALRPVIGALEVGTVPARLRGAVQMLMGWPAGARAGLVAAVAAAGRAAAGRVAADGRPRPVRPEIVDAYALASELCRRYPDDIGVVVALLLNRVRLRPDEAVYMPAGNLHAYLAGVGVEIMAASDNVLRGGLTGKRVDVAEMLRVLRYEVLADPVVRPEPLAPGVLTWPAPAAEFSLVKAVAEAASGPVTIPGQGPRILACLRGVARLRTVDEVHTVCAGESVFVPATDPMVEMSAESAVVFQASPGPESYSEASRRRTRGSK